MSKKILVVDDDPGAVRLVTSLLSTRGYEIVTAYNGKEALEKVKAENPDLIILDVIMPEMNGYDVCHTLRFDKKTKELPIILVTVRDQELGDVGQRLNIEYLQKPYDNESLMQKVRMMLGEDEPS